MNELQQEGDGIGLHTPGSIRLIEKGNEARYLEAKQQVTYNSFIHSVWPATALGLPVAFISDRASLDRVNGLDHQHAYMRYSTLVYAHWSLK